MNYNFQIISIQDISFPTLDEINRNDSCGQSLSMIELQNIIDRKSVV